MNITTTQRLSRLSTKFFRNLHGKSINVFTLMMIAALIAFESFNFSTTEYALGDMLGNMGFGSLRWATLLSLAFCGMDFAGIARLMTYPKNGEKNDQGGWFLLGAWVLAATMNAGLTWWGVSVAIYNQPADSVLILDPMTFVTAIPVLVSLGVWVIRILIMGTLISAFKPKDEQSLEARSKTAKRPIGFKSSPQAVPAGYKPINTHTDTQSERFRY